MNYIYDVDNVKVIKLAKTILDNISLKLEAGKIIGVIGENGAGKSTFLKVLSGLLRVDAGFVKLNATNLESFSVKERSKLIAFLPQSTPEQVNLNVRQLVAMGRSPWLNIYGKLKKNDENIIDNALVDMNLKHLASQSISSLSGGEKQRAFIAKAFCQDSYCTILDEPLNGLDYPHQSLFFDKINNLTKVEHKTIIFTLHDLNIAAKYADYIVALNNGKVVAYDLACNFLNEEVLNKIFSCKFNVIEDKNLKLKAVYPEYKS